MDAAAKKNLKLYTLAAGLAALLLGRAYLSQIWSDPIGQTGLCIYGPLWNFSLIVAVVTALIGGLLYVSGHVQRSLLIVVPAAMFLIICIPFLVVRKPVATYRTNQLLETLNPLITAIEQYEQDNGHMPKDLHDLIPDYMRSIPRTVTGDGFDSATNFIVYSNDPSEHGWVNEPWAMLLEVQMPVFDYGYMLYLPSQNYPKDAIRYGDWAYLGVNKRCWGEYRNRCQ